MCISIEKYTSILILKVYHFFEKKIHIGHALYVSGALIKLDFMMIFFISAIFFWFLSEDRILRSDSQRDMPELITEYQVIFFKFVFQLVKCFLSMRFAELG